MRITALGQPSIEDSTGLQDAGPVVGYHLDEYRMVAAMASMCSKLENLNADTGACIYLFSLPQVLLHQGTPWLEVLYESGLLWLTINEAHLYLTQGLKVNHSNLNLPCSTNGCLHV